MSKKALKLVLEMVQNKMYAHAEMYLKEALAQPEQLEGLKLIHKADIDLAKKRALEAQPEQEPAALRTMRMWITALKSVSDNGQHMNIPSGLSSGTCWELAVELERFINTTPPQRTAAEGEDTRRAWVGLTNNELQPIADEYRILFGSWVEDFARAIEAKLKAKNERKEKNTRNGGCL